MNRQPILRRYPLVSYFVLAYAIAWAGCFAAVGPRFFGGQPLEFRDTLLLFLAMLAGPSVAGLMMARATDPRNGIRRLFHRMRRWQVSPRWWIMALLLPPSLFITVLLGMSRLVGPEFTPRFIPAGIVIGLLAGFLEEIGWTGFAFPRLRDKFGILAAAIVLGLLHSLWHVVADYLGSSTAFGLYWLPHFLIWMVTAMTAMRVLIVWVYANTRSVLLAQVMHASSTGALATLGPALSPTHDIALYAVYAAVLWLVVAVVVSASESLR